jgi:fatty acid desaturase
VSEVRCWNELHRELLRRFRAAGLMERRAWPYVWRGGLVVAAYACGYAVAVGADGWGARLGGLLLAAVAAIQGGMIAHDLVHRAVTTRPRLSRWLGQLFMTVLTGQSYAHWEWQHQEHHRVTQEAAGDPDMDVNLFALSEPDAQRKRGLFRFTTRWQHVLIWPVVTLMVITIRANSLAFVARRRAWLDAFFLGVHAALWVGLPALALGPGAALLNYFLFTWMMGPYAAASFIWNHVGTRVIQPGERLPFFVQRLIASRNLSSHWLVTAVFGSLNIHIEHHLAPHIPGPSLPRARPIFRQLCEEHGLPFRVWGYGEAMVSVYRHFKAVAETLRPPAPRTPTPSGTGRRWSPAG